MATPKLLAWAALIGLVALVPANSQIKIVDLDGSGTSNHATVMWRAADWIKARSKPFAQITYRSIGTGAGQDDLTVTAPMSRSDFGCGDFPLSRERWAAATASGNPVLHVPLLVGSVSVFANLPGDDSLLSPVRLSPCTLIKIFKGEVTQWDDADIVADNKDNTQALALLKGPIQVVKRRNGSSSTFGLTNYLNKTQGPLSCASTWPAGSVGSNVNVWPANAVEVSNSQSMVAGLLARTGSIGYVESGQGIDAGLHEVAILGASGDWLVTNDFSTEIYPKSPEVQAYFARDLSADWSDVSLIYMNEPRLWPITLVTYAYVRQNVTSLGDAGGLLKMYMGFLLGNDVQTWFPALGFKSIASAQRNAYRVFLEANLQIAADSAVWQYEVTTNNMTDIINIDTPTAAAVNAAAAQADFVISKQRDSYVLRTIDAVVADVDTLKSASKFGNPYQVHGSGSPQAAPYMQYVQALLTDRARVDIDATYRSVPSEEAQLEFSTFSTAVASMNNFKVSSYPLWDPYWKMVAATPGTNGMVHLPFAATPIGIFYNQQLPVPAEAGLKLTPCLMAGIMSGRITKWDDPIFEQNPNNFPVSGTNIWPGLQQPITVFAYPGASGPTYTLSMWMSGCAGGWTSSPVVSISDGQWKASQVAGFNPRTSFTDPTTGQVKTIMDADDMAAAIASTPHSIGYLPVWGASPGDSLVEAQVVNAKGNYLNSTRADLTATVLDLWNSRKIPANISDNWWPITNTSGSGIDGGWPLTQLLYIYSYKNLTAFGSAGPLAKALFSFVLGQEGQALLPDSGLFPLPPSMQVSMLDAMAQNVQPRAGLPAWAFESKSAVGIAGMSLLTFSAARQGYTTTAITELKAQLASISRASQSRGWSRVRVAGPAGGGVGVLVSSMLNDLRERALSRISASYEEVRGDAAAAMHHLLPMGQVDLLVSDQPLRNSAWEDLAGYAANPTTVLQVPFLVRPVALMVRAPARITLRMSPCTLAKVLSGDVQTWDHADVRNDNPGVSLPSTPLRIFAVGGESSGNTRALRNYLAAACPSIPTDTFNTELKTNDPKDNTLVNPGMPRNVEAVALDPEALINDLAAAPEFSGIALVSLATGANAKGLSEVALPITAGSSQFITPSQTTKKEYSALLDGVNGALDLPNAQDDWSEFNIVQAPENRARVYPLVRLDYIIIPSELTSLGSSGSAVTAVAEYLVHPTAQASLTTVAEDPWACPLSSLRATSAKATFGAMVTLSPDAIKWAILDGRSVDAATQAPQSFGSSEHTILMSQVTHTTVITQQAEAVVQLAAASGGLSTGGVASYQDITDAAIVALTAQVRDAKDRADKAWSIAVAAIVLGLLIGMSGLIMACWVAARTHNMPAVGKQLGGSSDRYHAFDDRANLPTSTVTLGDVPLADRRV